MSDPFENANAGLTGVHRGGAEVTPSDGDDLSFVARGLFIGTGGTIKIDTPAGDTLTFTVQSGQYLPWGATKVYATGTTADDIVAGR